MNTSPIVFLRPIGIAAADALRLMEASRRMSTQVRWRMAPSGVAADAYVVHKHSVVPLHDNPGSSSAAWGKSETEHVRSRAHRAEHGGDSNQSFVYSSSAAATVSKLTLDQFGWHRGRPVAVLGKTVDTSGVTDDELAPLVFPEALREMQQGLTGLVAELVGVRMLYLVGALAWEDRERWHSHRLHAIESGQLLAVVEPQHWQFHLLDGCTVERLENATLTPMPRSGAFAVPGFQKFALELALWEFAKRCPEELLGTILPDSYLVQPLTHRRLPQLKEHALGEHCVALLRALDTRARTATELETSLRLSRTSILRALTCLALVRAIQPQQTQARPVKERLSNWWRSITGKHAADVDSWRMTLR
jgi:hypothetical protein